MKVKKLEEAYYYKMNKAGLRRKKRRGRRTGREEA